MKTTEELTLLPCPACGGAAEFFAVEGRICVSCPHCGMRGPSLSESCRNFKEIDDQIDADGACIAAWNALPRRTLRWSREFPTQPGKYWHRNNYLAPHVTNVDTAFIKRAASVENVDNEEFAGPLPEPEGDG